MKRDLLNTLYHAAAIVGLNTSVFLEAAVLNRPGLILVGRDHGDSALRRHTEFPHFQLLANGSFLNVVEDEQACAEAVLQIVRGHDPQQDVRRAFVRRFIRPHGLDLPASRVAVNLFERLVASDPALCTRPERTRSMGLPQRNPTP
jgi:hypothetical protein